MTMKTPWRFRRTSSQRLSPQECEQVLLAIDYHLEGLRKAKEETIKDRTVDSPDDLNFLASTYEEQEATLETAKRKISNDTP